VRVSLAVLAFLAFGVGCGSERNTLERLWQGAGQAVVLTPGTSDYGVGDVRFSFLVVTQQARPILEPKADVWVARSRNDVPIAHAVARLEPVGVIGGSTGYAPATYVVHLRLRRPGRYWVVARPRGGSVHVAGLHDLEVKATTATPSVGSRAFASHTPTLSTAPARLLTTRVPPDRALLRYSVADSLAAHVPFVLVFATPRFCVSRTCAPTVDVVDAVRRRDAGDGVRFIHVEIYKGNNPANGYNRWVRRWRLPSEPWIFLVGRDGRIKAKFEGPVSVGELEAAVRRWLA
jgi:hypothetical protein